MSSETHIFSLRAARGTLYLTPAREPGLVNLKLVRDAEFKPVVSELVVPADALLRAATSLHALAHGVTPK